MFRRKDIWHKLNEGSFDKNGLTYDYVIEQNNGLPVETDSRVRIIKSTPTVKAVTTRYDPELFVEGDAGAYIPSYFGYDIKYLKGWIWVSIVIYMMIWFITFVATGIDLTKKVGIWLTSTLPLNSFHINLPIISSKLVIWGMLAFMMFYFFIPIIIREVEKKRTYFLLKKEGLSYKEVKK